MNNPTELTATDNGTTIRFEDDGARSTVTEPTTAAEFRTIAASSYYLEMGKQNAAGNALFMFEMRDPSINLTVDGDPVPVPEPSALAGIFGLAALLVARRRS